MSSEISEPWKWERNSLIHREKFEDLLKHGREKPEEVQEINEVRVLCLPQFRIGEGSRGTLVYIGLAKDGYERAVKRLHKTDASAEFVEHERLILNKPNAINSNHVVRYWSSDDQGPEYAFVILGLCEETLKSYIEKKKSDDPVTDAPKIISHILRGLADLHGDQPPILHRDVKPSNILRNERDEWLLADFGISRVLPEGAFTYASIHRGTAHWIAVESYVVDGKPKDDKVRYKTKSDVQVGFPVMIICTSLYEYVRMRRGE